MLMGLISRIVDVDGVDTLGFYGTLSRYHRQYIDVRDDISAYRASMIDLF
jgi:hypothetical protein